MVDNYFLRYLFGPLVTFLLTVIIYLAARLEGYTLSLALPFIGLAVTAIYGGFRANIASAFIIIAFIGIETDYDFVRSSQVALAALSIALVNGFGKRVLWRMVVESETNRRKAELVDTLNGNIKRMLAALDILADLRKHGKAYTPQKREELVEKAHDGLADLITSVQGWKEMAETREIVIREMDRIGRYPWRAEDVVTDTHALVREILMKINRMEERGKE